MSSPRGAPSAASMIVQSVTVAGRTYELRRNRCGKHNCRTCYGPHLNGEHRPGHGPYWYLIIVHPRGVRRIYVGKELNTQKFLLPDGTLDPAAKNIGLASRRAPAETQAKIEEINHGSS